MRNVIVNRHYLSEGKVAELLAKVRADPELSADKWKITVSNRSMILAVEGPNKGKSEKGYIITLDSLTRDEQRTLWLTDGPSVIFTE